MHARKHIVEVSTQDTHVDGKALYEVTDATLSATLTTAQNSHNLLDFSEYKQI